MDDAGYRVHGAGYITFFSTRSAVNLAGLNTVGSGLRGAGYRVQLTDFSPVAFVSQVFLLGVNDPVVWLFFSSPTAFVPPGVPA